MNFRIINFSLILLSSFIIVTILIVAKSLLIPLVLGLFFWYLINTLAQIIKSTKSIGHYLPVSISLGLAIIILLFFLWILIHIITSNVTELIKEFPHYQMMFTRLTSNIALKYHIDILSKLNSFFSGVNLQNIVAEFYLVFSTVTSSSLIIIVYIIFFMIEQKVFRAKVACVFNNDDTRYLILNILSNIEKDTQSYLMIKTFTNLLAAIPCWLIMKSVALDFAEFWAVLIFILTYIPVLGAIIATVFPILLAFILFSSITPILVIVVGLISVQLLVGSFIEPRLMGHSLNLSPLIILISLSVWGMLWGVIGMFLSIPITVMILIICSRFETTRPIAVILSQNGTLNLNN